MNPTINYIISELDGIYSHEEAREMAFWVVEETTGLSRAAISARKDTQNISNIEIILKRLRKKEPIQYIFGHTLWYGLDLLVNTCTLIPRPETAELVDLILQTMPENEPLNVLDIGTGTGAIALALKSRRPNWSVSALDFSPSILSITAANAQRNGNLQLDLIQMDILENTHDNLDNIGKFDIVVSNPPYICESEKTSMESNVLDYEPASALFVPDDDPLLFYRRIASLKSGKHLFFEINSRFGLETAQLLRDFGYFDVNIYQDMYGKQRYVSGRIEI